MREVLIVLVICAKISTFHAECGLTAEKYSGYYADVLTFFDGTIPISTTTLTSINLGDEGDYYSYRISGTFSAPESTTYTFRTSSDDASHVYIDDALIVDNSGVHATLTRSGTLVATASKTYSITIYFGENAVDGNLIFEWMGGSTVSWTTDLINIDPPDCCVCVYTAPTPSPTLVPTNAPTDSPTNLPTNAPTFTPTDSPTTLPTNAPTFTPTNAPTFTPTNAPTSAPTSPPTNSPTFSPSKAPSVAPTYSPTQAPSLSPTNPTVSPSTAPTMPPSYSPTSAPTITWTMCKTDIECTYIAKAEFTMKWSAIDGFGSLLSTIHSLEIDIRTAVQMELKEFINIENMYITANPLSSTNADTQNGASATADVATDDRNVIDALFTEINNKTIMESRIAASLTETMQQQHQNSSFNVNGIHGEITMIKPESLDDGDKPAPHAQEEQKYGFIVGGVVLLVLIIIAICCGLCLKFRRDRAIAGAKAAHIWMPKAFSKPYRNRSKRKQSIDILQPPPNPCESHIPQNIVRRDDDHEHLDL